MPCGQPGILLGQIIPEEISTLILDLEHEKMQRKSDSHGGAQTTILVDDSFLKNGKNEFLLDKNLDGVHFRCGKLLLRHPWTDLDETLGMYRVDLEIMHREIFDFDFRCQTGSQKCHDA